MPGAIIPGREKRAGHVAELGDPSPWTTPKAKFLSGLEEPDRVSLTTKLSWIILLPILVQLIR